MDDGNEATERISPMSRKTALITGATDGIGKAAAAKLLSEGWEVVIVGRNSRKCDATVKELKEKTKSERITSLTADLSLLSDVKKATENFLRHHTTLDFLLLNANAIANDRIVTGEGNEQNFALGYLSRALMITMLEKTLAETPNSQILAVIGMDTQPVDFNDLTIQHDFTGRKGLGRWQWAMNVFAAEYNKTGEIPLNLYMPGLVKTKILANEPQPMRAFVKFMNMVVGISPEQSAENIFFVMNDIVSSRKKGTCYSWKKERSLPKIAMTAGDGERLLKATEELTALYI
jgi:NAD(P)-dependent dehydrogenase (short-subunit alcohol dehydrogenase family)